MSTTSTDTKLINLSIEWKQAKDDESAAKERRLLVESKMIDLIGSELPDKGTYKTGSVKITTGYTRKWYQEILNDIKKSWKKSWPAFPFIGEWKPRNDEIKYLQEHSPEAYAALTEAFEDTSNKPSFST